MPDPNPPPAPAILFVCTGNICRSPAAEGVLRAIAIADGLPNLAVDSAGTGDWHAGEPPDPRTVRAAQNRGYDIASLVARRVQADDFRRFTVLYGMAREHLQALQNAAPTHPAHPDQPGDLPLARVLPFPGGDVADPYFGGERGFSAMMDQVESGCREILNSLRRGEL